MAFGNRREKIATDDLHLLCLFNTSHHTGLIKQNPLHAWVRIQKRSLRGRTAEFVPMLRELLAKNKFPADSLEVGGDGALHLNLAKTGIDDLSFLAGMPLDSINLFSTPVSDLSPLKGMPLTSLIISRTKVDDLTPLKGIMLKELVLSSSWGACGVEDLSPLKGMPLTSLDLRKLLVRDLTPLADIPLEELTFDPKTVETGIEVMSKSKTLKTVNGVSASNFFLPIKYREQLKPFGSIATIRMSLDKHGTIILGLPRDRSSVTDLTSLRGMPISSLTIIGTAVTNLSPLSDMPLTNLTAWGCTTLSDLSPLSGLPLQRLSLGYTQVKDLSPLKGMPLTRLEITSTSVSDLSPLIGLPLEHLDLANTVHGSTMRYLTDLTPLASLPLKTLTLYPSKNMKGQQALRNMKSLTTINNLPASEYWQQVDAGTLKRGRR